MDKSELMQGTLNMLVLRALRGGSLHGYAIANKIQEGLVSAINGVMGTRTAKA